MSNEKLFYTLCENMAGIEDVITMIESLGLLVEPDEGIGLRLYSAASSLYRIASELLEFPDVTIENDVCNDLLSAGSDKMLDISQRIWSEYGIK